MTIDQALALALQHHQAGRLGDAESIYRQILTAVPLHADALHLLGLVALQTRRADAAIELIEKAIQQNPQRASYHSNSGEACRVAGRFDEAMAACRNAIRLKPDLADAHFNLGVVLAEQGQLDAAIAAFGEVIRIAPAHARVHTNLGAALWSKGELPEAIAMLRVAVELNPASAEARYNLGAILASQGLLDEAIDVHRAAIGLKPDSAEAYNNLGGALADRGQSDQAIAAFREAIRIKPDYVAAHSNLIFTMAYDPAYDAAAIAEESRRWNDRYAAPPAAITSYPNDRDANRRLRIGYVSADFRVHASSCFLLPLFENHDPQQVELFCYANVVRPDEMTRRTQQTVEKIGQWRSTIGVRDERVAEQIRADCIDILVDLKLHTSGNRLVVFAHKPAPVQVSWLGYPGTTGMTTIDYRLSDPWLDPPGMDESIYSEKTVRLAETFWCYDALGQRDLPIGALPASRNGFVTFGSLNGFRKINDGVLRLWAGVLRSVPDSRFLLLAPEGTTHGRTLEIFQAEGIDRERIEFASLGPREQYMKIYQRIDIMLDTFPYNGHTTSLDSFWMGVPVITLVGRTAVGRAGVSQLMNLNLPELIAHTPEQYIGIAAKLANDLPRLTELRATLRDRMKASPLTDGRRFARNVEAAYRQMWRTWCGA